MDGISALINECRWQEDILGAAESRDQIAIGLLEGRAQKSPHRTHRIWTRVDKNRLFNRNADADWQLDGSSLLDLPELIDRDYTRVQVIHRWLLKRRSIESYFGTALTETQSAGTYNVLAPLLVKARKAHDNLMSMWAAEYCGGDPPQSENGELLGWDCCEVGWKKALEEIEVYSPNLGTSSQHISESVSEASSEAINYLFGWREILVALDRQNNDENKRMIGRLNTEHSGPILIPGQGSQPKVDKQKLIAWWNHLEVIWTDSANQQAGARLDAEGSHNYGRAGTVIPAFAGSQKTRRADFGSQKVAKQRKTS